MLKVNLEALKARLESKPSANSKQNSKQTLVLKALEAGTVLFRAVHYPHQPDPESSPFLERYYHRNVGGEFQFYCPKSNDGLDCHICDYVWEVVGTKSGDEKKEWYEKLPKGKLIIPGLIRGREDEGVKFFDKISIRKDKVDGKHKELMQWFFDGDTADWLDPNKGIDMKIEYEPYDAAKSKLFGGAKFGFKGINLARSPSKFGTEPSYAEFVKTIPNFDEVVHSKKTTEDSLNLLKKWNAKSGNDLNKSPGMSTNKVQNITPKSLEKDVDVESMLKDAGL